MHAFFLTVLMNMGQLASGEANFPIVEITYGFSDLATCTQAVKELNTRRPELKDRMFCEEMIVPKEHFQQSEGGDSSEKDIQPPPPISPPKKKEEKPTQGNHFNDDV